MISSRSLLQNFTKFRYCQRFVSSELDVRHVDLSAPKTNVPFDTHAVVKSLEKSGFTLEQSEVLTGLLHNIIQAHSDALHKSTVTKAQQEIFSQQVLGHVAALKKDMVILEKSEFGALRAESDKMKIELTNSQNAAKDSLSKLQSLMRLDINLEKSRSQGEVQEMRSHIMQVQASIDKHVAELNTTFEKYRNDIMKFSAGAIFSCLTVFLAFYRIIAH